MIVRPLIGSARAVPAARGFQQNKHRLRGRKFYLPHGDVLADPKPAYWDGSPATSSIRINGRNGFREYVAPPGSPPRVGTAITQWIPAGTTFEPTWSGDRPAM